MAGSFTVACVQTNTKRDPADNIAEVSPLIREAAARGAALVTTPEVVGMIEPKRELALEKARGEADHEVLAAFRGLAAELGVWLLIGSTAVKVSADKLANRSFLVDPGGGIVARYDKMHMFDVQVDEANMFRESRTYAAGDTAVIAELPWGRLGMTICYDLRFPYLYRALAHAGADFLAIPSNFTRPTGEAHWHTLLRARAIETGCYVFAPAQTGEHAEGRKSYGHSLIVAPWGEVLADGGVEVGVVTAEIDPAAVSEARRRVPSLTHDRTVGTPIVFRREQRAAGE